MTSSSLDAPSGLLHEDSRVSLFGLVVLALVVHVVALGTLLLPTESPIGYIRAVMVFLDLTFIPGFLAVLLLSDTIVGDDGLITARGIAYIVGLSLLFVMATGFVIDVVLLYVGYERPLSVLPLSIGITMAIVGLAGAVAYTKDWTESVDIGMSLRKNVSPTPLGLLLLPSLVILAVHVRTVTTAPITLILVAIALIPLLVSFSVVGERWHALGIWSISIALLYHNTLSGRFGFAGQPSVINAWRLERWTPGLQEIYPTTTSILPNGVLFPTYANLSGLNILVELNVLNPLLVSLLPVALYLTYRRYVGAIAGFLGACLFVFAHPFYTLYPQGGRVATPVLFLGLFALALSDDRLSPVYRRGFTLAFALGIAVSHYGTSYYVMFAFVGALLLLLGFIVSDELMDRLVDRKYSISNGGQRTTAAPSPLGRHVRPSASREGVVSWVFVGFYVVAVLSWYLYTKTAVKFGILPRHIRKTLNSLFGNRRIGGGSTARRLQKGYGAVSIKLSKQLYLLLGVLMLIGLAKVYYDRFFGEEGSELADEFLAIGTMMFGTFVFTLLVPGAWGGGRPMMIVFTFTSVLAVIGTTALLAGLAKLVQTWNMGSLSRVKSWNLGLKLFAVLMAILLILNTGVAAATVFGGDAPSNVPTNTGGNPYYDENVETHVWLIVNEQAPVYGDVRAHGQSDWYRPVFSARSSEAAFGYSGNKPRGNLHTVLETPELERGYLLMLSHNVESDVILVGNPRSDVPYEYPVSEYQSKFDQRSILYTTGHSRIYYSNVTTGE